MGIERLDPIQDFWPNHRLLETTLNGIEIVDFLLLKFCGIYGADFS